MNDSQSSRHLFCFGLGYVGSAFARHCLENGWSVSGTCRGENEAPALLGSECRITSFHGPDVVPDLNDALSQATHVLITIPPQPELGDSVLQYYGSVLESCPSLQWVGYLSTTGVYGNRDGDWIDETAELNPGFAHQYRRADAESAWMELLEESKVPVHIFRLAGIYGPGRSILTRLQEGKAKRINLPKLVFNRVHVEDVVQVLFASARQPQPGEVYNVCDDAPASPREVVEYASECLKMKPPALQSLEKAGLSGQGQSFYLTNKRVRNEKIKKSLGVELRYPDYKQGLESLLKKMG